MTLLPDGQHAPRESDVQVGDEQVRSPGARRDRSRTRRPRRDGTAWARDGLPLPDELLVPPISDDHGNNLKRQERGCDETSLIGAAIRFMTSAPEPVAQSKGRSPMVMAATVITFGRTR